MKKILVIFLSLTAFFSTKAQETLVVNPEFSINTDFEFNAEWHYLTSDLYLFNATKFQSLLNDLYPVPPKKKRAGYDAPQNILITARIDGTTPENLCYPIYSFNIKTSDNGLTTYTSENYEAIRIVDNLPLSSVKNKTVDCKIDLEVITEESKNRIFDFVASQLKSVSSWTTAPLTAAQTFIGEMSNLLTAKTSGKEYKFSSTIRLYDGEDFNKRISSISVFSFIPAHISRAAIDSSAISKFMHSNDNPKIDKNKLTQLIKYYGYPFIVIVNYKSKYITEPVIGDETDAESVEARLRKVKRQYETGLLSQELYAHELKLIEYLKAFVALKQGIDLYKLNSKNRINDNFGHLFLRVFNDYRDLKTIYNLRFKEFSKDEIFKNEFSNTYKTIMTNADGYLEGDNNMKNIKNTVLIMKEHEAGIKEKTFDMQANENDLSVLHSVEFPVLKPEPEGITELKALIYKLESRQYEKVFKTKTTKLKSMPPSSEATELCENLKTEINNTYCRYCRETASQAVNDYAQRLATENDRKVVEKLSNTINEAKDVIFKMLQKEQTISKHFSEDYPNGLPADAEYVQEDFKKMQRLREDLQVSVKKDYSDKNTTEKDLISDDLHYKTQELAKILEQICKRMPHLCTE